MATARHVPVYHDLVRALDECLFTAGPWLAIDAANVEVKGTRTATLDQALALIGQGRVASVVGRLRPDVAGVDIDSPVFADEILNTLTAFCTSRGLWHLVRPSGGAPGRAHLLLIPGAYRDDLDDLVLRLRRELGRKADPLTGRRAAPLGRAHVDVRAQLRPLSAPHRCRPTPQLDHDVLTAALVDLHEVLAHCPSRQLPTEATPGLDGTGTRGTTTATSSRTSSTTATTAPTTRSGRHAERGLHEAQVPLSRPRHAVPAGWTAYLEQGRAAAAAAGLDREPSSRSTIEYDATRALILAGLDEDAAWAAIATAHPTAFVKARANGRRWWWHVWNAAVDKADDWLLHRRAQLTQQTATPATGEVESEVLAALVVAHAELEAQWRSWPAQTRHSLRELMLAVLERMSRKGTTAVELPQRDLLQDCALQSRNTIAARRDDLITTGLLQVTSTHVRGTTDTADTWSLPARFLTPPHPSSGGPSNEAQRGGAGDGSADVTNEQEHQRRGVGSSEPTRGSPPHRPALPLRRTLGLPRAHLLEVLLAGSTAHTLDQLAPLAGLTTGLPTADQQRTVRGHLQALASLGLALVDGHGGWTASVAARTALLPTTTDAADLVGHQDLVRLHRRGQDRQEAVVEAVMSERREFRARVDPEARRRRWMAQREQVLACQVKLDASRCRAWWDGLPPAQQQQRRAAAATAFAALPLHQQAQRKHDLAVRRARTGLSERDRYTTWWDALAPAERDERSVIRAAMFHALPQHLRSERVAAWTAHRVRWDLPRTLARSTTGAGRHPLIKRSPIPA